jgi:hypothetical protein
MGGNNYVLKTNKQGEKIYSINNQERLIDFGTTATVAIFDESTGQLIIANCGMNLLLTEILFCVGSAAQRELT